MKSNLLRVLFMVTIGLLCFHLQSAKALGGGYWKYHGSTYSHGSSYYGGCNYQGSYYQPGYWTYYYEKPVYLTSYLPYYVPYPVSFNGFSPASVTDYRTAATTAIAALSVNGAPPLEVTTTAVQSTARPAAAVQTTTVQQTATSQTRADSLLEQRVTTLEAKMDANTEIQLRILKVLEQKNPPPAGKQPEEIPAPKESKVDGQTKGLTVLIQKCASCHDKTANDQLADKTLKGGGHQFFFEEKGEDGKTTTVLKVTAEQILDMQNAILSGQMPKGSKGLAPEDGQAVLIHLNEYRAKQKAKKG